MNLLLLIHNTVKSWAIATYINFLATVDAYKIVVKCSDIYLLPSVGTYVNLKIIIYSL